jgi:hypothetical protein
MIIDRRPLRLLVLPLLCSELFLQRIDALDEFRGRGFGWRGV